MALVSVMPINVQLTTMSTANRVKWATSWPTRLSSPRSKRMGKTALTEHQLARGRTRLTLGQSTKNWNCQLLMTTGEGKRRLPLEHSE